jgi:hypothetical protein
MKTIKHDITLDGTPRIDSVKKAILAAKNVPFYGTAAAAAGGGG